MGYELDAFLGRESELRRWSETLPFAIVAPLGGELAMVPITGALYRELLAWHGPSAPGVATHEHFRAAMTAWLARESRGTTLAWLDAWEFGDDGKELGQLWADGALREVVSSTSKLLDLLCERGGIDAAEGPIDLERYRGELAGGRWAAEAVAAAQRIGSPTRYFVKRSEQGRHAVYRLCVEGPHRLAQRWHAPRSAGSTRKTCCGSIGPGSTPT